MSKRRGLGTSNLQTHIGRRKAKPEAPVKPPGRTSFAVSAVVGERVRDAADYEGRKVAAFVEELLLKGVEALERERGESFSYPPRRRKV